LSRPDSGKLYLAIADFRFPTSDAPFRKSIGIGNWKSAIRLRRDAEEFSSVVAPLGAEAETSLQESSKHQTRPVSATELPKVSPQSRPALGHESLAKTAETTSYTLFNGP
jgi:hypothetical protein